METHERAAQDKVKAVDRAAAREMNDVVITAYRDGPLLVRGPARLQGS